MSGPLLGMLVAGALVGLACAVAVVATRRWHPALAVALDVLDERVPARSGRRGGTRAVLRLLHRVPVAVADADLELLDLTRERFVVRAAAEAAALAALGPVVAGGMALIGTPLPFAVPGALAVVALVVGWTGCARRLRGRADDLRDQMRYTLVSYLQQVGLLRRGGAGVATALTLPARTLTDSWAMRRLRDELELAERAGLMPWEGLARFGGQIEVDELTDLSRIAQTAGQDGATVVATLLARAQSLENELLAAENAAAHQASGQLSTPGALQVFLIAAWVLFPSATALLTSV
ncbi:MAG: hypothetical protein L0K86_25770 [Actinomycetia bacterium]|nr:hypothetical protein [Actinomycetes bacterium]